ncbi:MAG: PEP-CTERM sorting domain-containing protein, partial [Methanomicrobiales archaeon]
LDGRIHGGLHWDTTQVNIDGTIRLVPEPSAIFLLLVAGGSLCLRRRSPFGGRERTCREKFY